MDNDRFLQTKKVNVEKVPDTSKNSALVSPHFETKIERSAKEVHEAYLKRIGEIKAKKRQDEQ